MSLVSVDAESFQRLVPMLVRGGIVFGVAHIHRSGCTESVDIVKRFVAELSFLSRSVKVFRLLEEGPGESMVSDAFFERPSDCNIWNALTASHPIPNSHSRAAPMHHSPPYLLYSMS